MSLRWSIADSVLYVVSRSEIGLYVLGRLDEDRSLERRLILAVRQMSGITPVLRTVLILPMMTIFASMGRALMTSNGMLDGPGALNEGPRASENSSRLVG